MTAHARSHLRAAEDAIAIPSDVRFFYRMRAFESQSGIPHWLGIERRG